MPARIPPHHAPPHRIPPDPTPQPADQSLQLFFGPDGLRAGWGLLLFIVLAAALGTAISFLASHLQNPSLPQASPARLVVSESTALLAVLLATLILSRVERRPFTTYGLAGPCRISFFARGLLYGLLTLSFLIALLHLTNHLTIEPHLLPVPEALRYGLIWAIAFILVAFLEETLLRGYLQYTLTRALTPIVEALSSTPNPQTYAFWSAALILSFFFGLGHNSNPGESPIGLVAAGLAGLVFSLALYRTGSLWWALGFHTAWDWAQSFLYGVPDSGLTIQHHLLATHPTGPTILSGGLTGPEGSIFILPTLALTTATILITLKPRSRPKTQTHQASS